MKTIINPIKTKYHCYVYNLRQFFWIDCEIVDIPKDKKNVSIKLLEFGNNSTPPGTVIKVQKKSLLYFRELWEEQEGNKISAWKKYSYFD